jgi:hypothetical protein
MKKKPKNQTRTERLEIRLTPQEMKRIVEQADGEGISTWARRNLLALTKK